ncbi:hypothetical protein BD779DRAFT_509095 [Infundibulicybe gibba]|nr:hypothetical protein BD779DRAFT_509095 [Infundibulicybe gibba]
MGGRLAATTIGAGVVSPFMYVPQNSGTPPPLPPGAAGGIGEKGAMREMGGPHVVAGPGYYYGGAQMHSPEQGPSGGASSPPPHAPSSTVSHSHYSQSGTGVSDGAGPVSPTGHSFTTTSHSAAADKGMNLMGIANPEAEGGLWVHRDAGRVVQAEEPREEIPPTYDSIPR